MVMLVDTAALRPLLSATWPTQLDGSGQGAWALAIRIQREDIFNAMHRI